MLEQNCKTFLENAQRRIFISNVIAGFTKISSACNLNVRSMQSLFFEKIRNSYYFFVLFCLKT